MLADGRGRFALRLGVVCVLLAAGGVSSLLAAGPRALRATTATTTTLVTSPAPSVLVLRGHGWGHGLGLSQWGAYGYAKHGWTYDRILAHYYTGTTLGPAKVTTVRVLLAQGKKATLDSVVAWTVTDATGRKVALAPGTLVLKPKLVVPGKHADAAADVRVEAAARRRRQAVPRQDPRARRREDAPGDRRARVSRRT